MGSSIPGPSPPRPSSPRGRGGRKTKNEAQSCFAFFQLPPLPRGEEGRGGEGPPQTAESAYPPAPVDTMSWIAGAAGLFAGFLLPLLGLAATSYVLGRTATRRLSFASRLERGAVSMGLGLAL